MTVTAKINETTEAFTTIYVTPKTAQTVDTVSITGLADLTGHNGENFALPTLEAETSNDYEPVANQTVEWKLNGTGAAVNAFDKPGVYKAEYTLKIKDNVEKTFKKDTHGTHVHRI